MKLMQCGDQVTGGEWLSRMYLQSTQVHVGHSQRMKEVVQYQDRAISVTPEMPLDVVLLIAKQGDPLLQQPEKPRDIAEPTADLSDVKGITAKGQYFFLGEFTGSHFGMPQGWAQAKPATSNLGVIKTLNLTGMSSQYEPKFARQHGVRVDGNTK